MTIKQWLYRAYNLNLEIEQMLVRKQREFERATKVTASFSASAGGGSSDPHKFERFAEYTSDIDNLIDTYCDVRNEIMSAIAELDDSRQREILRMKYFDGMTFEQIGNRMHYSEKQIRRIHNTALTIMSANVRL